MLKILFPLPNKITVAFSGGVDSVALVDFLSKKHDVTCAFYHHGTKTSDEAMEFVDNFCSQRNIPTIYGMLDNASKNKPKSVSQEEYWREMRYNFLEKINMPVITAHHLDDCVETYIWSCMHGTPKVIPLVRNNIVRPFLTTSKKELIDWCERKGLDWCEDLTNTDEKYTRNYVRKHLVPHSLKVNPGLYTVVKKIVLKKLSEQRANSVEK